VHEGPASGVIDGVKILKIQAKGPHSVFILRDLLRSLQARFSDSRLGRVRAHWFVFTLLAIIVPFTSSMTSNLLRSLQTLFGLDLRRPHRGRPATASCREGSNQFCFLRCAKTHHQCHVVQGSSWALAKPPQSPAKSFCLTPFTHGGLNYGAHDDIDFSETSVY